MPPVSSAAPTSYANASSVSSFESRMLHVSRGSKGLQRIVSCRSVASIAGYSPAPKKGQPSHSWYTANPEAYLTFLEELPGWSLSYSGDLFIRRVELLLQLSEGFVSRFECARPSGLTSPEVSADLPNGLLTGRTDISNRNLLTARQTFHVEKHDGASAVLDAGTRSGDWLESEFGLHGVPF